MTAMPLTEFADKLNEVIPVLMKEFSSRQNNELYKGNITLPQFIVLTFLENNGHAKMTDIANFMEVTTAAITGIVNRLVRFGYARRASDPRDRRIIIVRLTAKGEDLVRRVNRERRQMVLHIFGQISGPEREDYLRILTHIRDILLEQKTEKNNEKE